MGVIRREVIGYKHVKHQLQMAESCPEITTFILSAGLAIVTTYSEDIWMFLSKEKACWLKMLV